MATASPTPKPKPSPSPSTPSPTQTEPPTPTPPTDLPTLWPNQKPVVDGVIPVAEVSQDSKPFADEDLDVEMDS